MVQGLQLDLAKAEISKIIHALGALGCYRCCILCITGCIGALRHAGRPRAAGCTIAASTVTAAVSIVVAMLRTVPAAIVKEFRHGSQIHRRTTEYC